jgi:RNA binding exosome subunit
LTKKQFRLNVAELSHNIKEHIANRFSEELKESVASIQSAISPYTFYIRVEEKKLQEQHLKLKEAKESIQKIKGIIEQLTVSSSEKTIKEEKTEKQK